MTLESLMKAGLTEDQAKTVLKLHKDAIDGNYVPKATFEAEREKVKTANETIADRDKQITELGKFKGTAEELQQKVTTLTQENATAKTEYENKLKEMEETTAIRTAIADKVYSPEDILPKLDRSKLTIKDGKVEAGLVEQLNAIQKTAPHYFKPANSGGGNGGWPIGWAPFGKSPDESHSGGGSNAAKEFGQSLAKAQAQGNASAQKAADIYFK